jgi:hypothetical protein
MRPALKANGILLRAMLIVPHLLAGPRLVPAIAGNKQTTRAAAAAGNIWGFLFPGRLNRVCNLSFLPLTETQQLPV